MYLKKYANVIVVAQSGGDFTDPVPAVNSITTASETNPFLVKIMPGVYDLGTNALSSKAYVDVEGAGENVTVITGSVNSAYLVSIAAASEIRFLTVRSVGAASAWSGAILNHGALTHVTVNASGSNEVYALNNRAAMNDVIVRVASDGSAVGVMSQNATTINDITVDVSAAAGTAFASGGNGVTINNAKITMTATGGEAFGLALAGQQVLNDVVVSVSGHNAQGLYSDTGPLVLNNVVLTAVATAGYANGANYGAVMTMNSVTVTASATAGSHALYNWSGTTTLSNVTAIAKNGTNNIGLYNAGTDQSTRIDRSTLEGATHSIYQTNAGSVNIGSSKLTGNVGGNPAYTCVASYNGTYQPVNSLCQ